jgi:hypothetical protein
VTEDDLNAGSLLGRIGRQRYQAALATVEAFRRADPQADAETLTSRMIRDCARELALGGAMTGGAAAAPGAGAASFAAEAGAEMAYSTSRLGELVMAIGIVHGLDASSAAQRTRWLAGVLGVSEGAAAGITGLAARAGSRAGGRMLARVAAAGTAAGAGRTRRMAGRLATRGGPWSAAALLPYGIGAGVGAVSNATLALTVGRAAERYFEAETKRVTPTTGTTDEVWDGEFISETIHDDT